VRLAVTVSVGISTYSFGVEKEALIKSADKALYRAKWEGKNRVSSEADEKSGQ
jgi:diguanylate cyclase (GGDEF)-like protein